MIDMIPGTSSVRQCLLV